MGLTEIVSCWAERKIDFAGDFDALRGSFEDAGFREVTHGPTEWRFKRGTSVGATFDYGGEALEVQVVLRRDAHGPLTLKVGNWGFPFEPLLMKSRFHALADRLADQISEEGIVTPSRGEAERVEAKARSARTRAALVIGIGIVIAIVILLRRLLS